MIYKHIDPDNLCIDKINFEYKNIQINDIPVKFLFLRNKYEDKNVGEIIESYRKSAKDKFDEEEYVQILQEIDKVKIYLTEFNASHLILIKSKHEEITNLIKKLSDKISSNSKICPIEISDCFTKVTSKSITEYENVTDDLLEDYFLNETIINQNHISRLLIIDDVINKGRTINQLLIRLAENKNIDNKSSIFIYTIYSMMESPCDSNKIKKIIFGGNVKPFDE